MNPLSDFLYALILILQAGSVLQMPHKKDKTDKKLQLQSTLW